MSSSFSLELLNSVKDYCLLICFFGLNLGGAGSGAGKLYFRVQSKIL